MALDIPDIEKNIAKLRKSLKKPQKRWTPDDVHKLRTRARRFEAMTSALPSTPGRRARRLLRRLKRIRKMAGRVRDRDVLTSHLATLHENSEEDCLIQLFEYLGAERYKDADRLRGKIKKLGPSLRKGLKRLVVRIDASAQKQSPGSSNEPAAEASTRLLQLTEDLEQPVTLNRGNLHPYRLKIKELRYALQMSDNPPKKWVDALGECKDAIGEWHDWEELVRIASEILDHEGNCEVMRRLKAVSTEKFEHALLVTKRMREAYAGEERDRGSHDEPQARRASAAVSSRAH